MIKTSQDQKWWLPHSRNLEIQITCKDATNETHWGCVGAGYTVVGVVQRAGALAMAPEAV